MSQGEGDAPPVGALEDPELLAEIEAEFAELTAELDRINAMPRAMAPKKAELVKSLREQWFAKQATRPDRPEWRKKMDDALGEAISKVLEDGINETGDGRLEFALSNDSVQTHGGPLMEALLVGFRQMLTEKLAKRPEPAPPGAPATPPNPLQGLMMGLGQMLAQALDNTQKTVAERKAANAEVQRREEGDQIKVEVRPGADATVEMDVRDINASVGFDTRKGDAVPPILPEMFQSVVAGLGKMLSDATRAHAQKAAPTPAAPPQPDAAAAETATATASEPANTSTVAARAADDVTTAAGDAPEIAPPTEPVEGASPDPDLTGSAAPADQGAPIAPKTPTLKVDFAGLLGQLFKLAPHGLATRRPGGSEPAETPAPAPSAPDGAPEGAEPKDEPESTT